MEYSIAKPSPELSKFIQHYWSIENCLPARFEHVQRIVPNGLHELIFYFGDKPVSDNNDKSISENTQITGQLKGFYDIRVSGKLSLFSILFRPHGLSIFLDISLIELFNQSVPLRFLLKNGVSELESKLFEAGTFSQRICIVETYLLKLLHQKEHYYNLKRIEQSINLINRSKGVVDIDFLASEACLSRKQFERVFAHHIGTTPKQFLKIIRFQHSIDEKARNKDINLTDLTFRCGYYDQSHMINDFQKLAGMSPSQYFNECEPYSDYFQ